MARYISSDEAKAAQAKRLKEIEEQKKKQEKAKRQERIRQALAANQVIQTRVTQQSEAYGNQHSTTTTTKRNTPDPPIQTGFQSR